MDYKNLKVPVILFFISLILNLYGIWWGLPNYYTWSTDDQTPIQPLLIANSWFKVNSEYPIFHYVLLDVVYSPYLAYLYLSGGLINPHKGFPYGFTDPLTSLTVLLVLSRLVSALMGSLAGIFVYLSVKSLYGKKAAFFSALCVSFSYIFILFSHLGNLDIPYIFWFTIALYAYVQLIKTYKARYYLLLGVFAGLSVSTKDQIVGFFVLLPVPLLYLHFKHHIKELGLKKTVFNKKLFYVSFTPIITYMLATNLIFNFSGYVYRLSRWSESSIGRYAQFPNTFLGQLQLFWDTIFKLEYSVGIALFFLMLISLIYCLYKFDRYTFALIIPLIFYYFFDIARIGYVEYRMTIPVIIVLSFFAGKLLSDIIKSVSTRSDRIKRFVYLLIILVFVYSFLYGFSADLSMVYDSRHSAEKWMVKNIDKNAKIEVYHHYQILPRFHALGFENVSITFLDYKGAEKPPVLLFEPVVDSPSLESLKKRNPDYIILPNCCYDIDRYNPPFKEYVVLLLSEKLGYKIIKVFDNNIPFEPETPLINKRTNVPIIILKRESY